MRLSVRSHDISEVTQAIDCMLSNELASDLKCMSQYTHAYERAAEGLSAMEACKIGHIRNRSSCTFLESWMQRPMCL